MSYIFTGLFLSLCGLGTIASAAGEWRVAAASWSLVATILLLDNLARREADEIKRKEEDADR